MRVSFEFEGDDDELKKLFNSIKKESDLEKQLDLLGEFIDLRLKGDVTELFVAEGATISLAKAKSAVIEKRKHRRNETAKLFTIGYGGRKPEEFISLLIQNGVRTLVDIRLRPDRASMGIWVKAKTAEKGIERLLNQAGIKYSSQVELGNIFREQENWQELYQQLLSSSGELLVRGLDGLEGPICLMCAEKQVSECHRRQVAEYLVETRGYDVVHLE